MIYCLPFLCNKVRDRPRPYHREHPGLSRSAAVWSEISRGQAATLLDCRSRRLILPASDSNSCVKSSRGFTDAIKR